jgi:MFS family permease
MVPQVLAIITATFHDRDRAKAFGLFGATAGLATVLGPLLSGLLLQAGPLGWRSVFLVNVPIGLGVLLAARRLLPESRATKPPRLDLVGVGLFTAALGLLLVPLIEGPQRGWPAPLLIALAAAVPAFALLGRHQHRRELAGGSPLIPPALFRRRSFAAGTLAGLAFFSVPPALFFVITLSLQQVGLTPLHTALAFVPLSVASVPTAVASVALAPRLGRRLPTGGAVVVITGIAELLYATHDATSALTVWTLLPGLVLTGLGLGLVSPTLIDVVLSDVGPADAGSASGVLNTALQLGGAIGIALIGLVYYGSLPDRLPGTSDAQYQAALTNGLWYALAVAALSAMAMLLLPPGRHAAPGQLTTPTTSTTTARVAVTTKGI